jgi:hypothetical protein
VLCTWNNRFTLSNVMSHWVLMFFNRLDMVLDMFIVLYHSVNYIRKLVVETGIDYIIW